MCFSVFQKLPNNLRHSVFTSLVINSALVSHYPCGLSLLSGSGRMVKFLSLLFHRNSYIIPWKRLCFLLWVVHFQLLFQAFLGIKVTFTSSNSTVLATGHFWDRPHDNSVSLHDVEFFWGSKKEVLSVVSSHCCPRDGSLPCNIFIRTLGISDLEDWASTGLSHWARGGTTGERQSGKSRRYPQESVRRSNELGSRYIEPKVYAPAVSRNSTK